MDGLLNPFISIYGSLSDTGQITGSLSSISNIVGELIPPQIDVNVNNGEYDVHNVYGSLSTTGRITGSLSSTSNIIGSLTIPQHIDADIYDGMYDINPDFIGTTLETRNKTLRENITVKPIQVESVSNLEGGRTVYIGGII